MSAEGEGCSLVESHPLYLALGTDQSTRQAAYRDVFRDQLDPELIDRLRRATNGNFALGDLAFTEQISQAIGRRATPGISGRPRKRPDPVSEKLF